MKHFIAALVLFTAIAAVTVFALTAGPAPEGEMKGKKAPDFTLTSVDGKKVKLADYKNKIVIVDFWATWCGPCRRGIPDLVALQNEYKKDVVIIGISVDRDKKAVPPFVKEYKINYPIVYADAAITEQYGGIQAIPTSFIIGRDGKIYDQHVGLVPKSEYVTAIKALLK